MLATSQGRPASVAASVVFTDREEESAQRGAGRYVGLWWRLVIFPVGSDPLTSQHLRMSLSPSHPPLLAAKGLLRSVDHVEEAVLVSLLLIDLRDGRGHRHHAVLVDQQEEGLRGVELQPAPGRGGGGGDSIS